MGVTTFSYDGPSWRCLRCAAKDAELALLRDVAIKAQQYREFCICTARLGGCKLVKALDAALAKLPGGGGRT